MPETSLQPDGDLYDQLVPLQTEEEYSMFDLPSNDRTPQYRTDYLSSHSARLPACRSYILDTEANSLNERLSDVQSNYEEFFRPEDPGHPKDTETATHERKIDREVGDTLRPFLCFHENCGKRFSRIDELR